jgi:hypothetical protein
VQSSSPPVSSSQIKQIAVIREAIQVYACRQGRPLTTATSVLLDKYWQNPSIIPSIVDEVTDPRKALSNSFFTNRSDDSNGYPGTLSMTLDVDPTTLGGSV